MAALASMSSYAQELKQIEQKIEQSSGKSSKPTPTPAPNPKPVPIGSSLDASDDDSTNEFFQVLFWFFSGSGSPSGKLLKTDLYLHGATDFDDILGFDVGAQANLSRLFLKAEYESLLQSNYSLRSTRVKVGYTLGIGPMSIAGFMGGHKLHGDFKNDGFLLGASLNLNITDKIRTEVYFENSRFGGSRLDQYVITGQYKFASSAFADLGLRQVRLAGEDIRYTVFFAGARWVYEE